MKMKTPSKKTVLNIAKKLNATITPYVKLDLAKWSKRLDDVHYFKPGNNCLCGKIRLGNNYASLKADDHPICKECEKMHITAGV